MARSGGIIHTYRGYDPQRFPLPASSPPDIITPALDHMLAYGSLDHLTEEQLAEAIEIDPSQIQGLGPSLGSLIARLEERKRKILATYETEKVQHQAQENYQDYARRTRPPATHRARYWHAVKDEQIAELERLWYRTEQRSDFGRHLVHLMEHLGNKYEIEDLISKYQFTGKQSMSIDQALEIKQELETIDKLIEQLNEAAKNAKIYLINMEELAQFVSEEEVEGLGALQQQVEDMLRHLAEQQGLKRDRDGYQLTPKALKLFQSRLLDQIFSELQAARSGRHADDISGDGAVEMQRTKPYEFGDSLANMDVGSSMINAMIREPGARPVRITPEDIEIHLTRNTPKCASVVCMDMSGSMRWGGQYINVKRMALALDGLIRKEYPGDFLDFVEIASLPKRRHVSEIIELLPNPVTVHDPVVRLKVDMSSTDISEFDVPPHFTNIQHGLKLARQLLEVQDTPNRQIILITDGLPTAHFEQNWLYLLYPPDPRTEQHTLREALLCHNAGITINIFLISSWAQCEEDIKFARRLAESTAGRVFFVGGRDLDRYVVWDYIKRRRFIIG